LLATRARICRVYAAACADGQGDDKGSLRHAGRRYP
jgi:hypothetical protein